MYVPTAAIPCLFFAIVRSELFYCPFPFVFLGPFTLATFYVSYSSGFRKKLGPNYRQSLC